MECKELKKAILDKSLTFTSLIFTYKDNDFIANQYMKAIASFNGYNIQYIESIDQLPHIGLFGEGNDLYVLNTDKFNTVLDDTYSRVIVICKETTCTDNVVNIPEATEEQVLDYMKTRCNGLSTDELKWLYDISKGDIFRIDRELSKISIFNKNNQEEMFNLLNIEDNYSDLSPLTIYNFVNAIIKKDKQTMYNILTNLDNIDIEGTGLVTILRRNIRNIIDIQFNPSATADKLGMKQNQFMAIKYNVGKFTNTKLIDIFDFLTSIDYKLKSGNLQFDNDRLIDYIVVNIIGD